MVVAGAEVGHVAVEHTERLRGQPMPRLVTTGASLAGSAFWATGIELGQLCPSHPEP